MSVMKRLVAPFTLKRSANDSFRARKTTVLKAKQQQAEQKAKLSELNPYRAVAIVPGDCACDAATGVAGKRFLVASGEAPMIPMPGCDAARCTCRYTHFDDRRDTAAGDRRAWSSLKSELFTAEGDNENRRQKKKRGRRKTD